MFAAMASKTTNLSEEILQLIFSIRNVVASRYPHDQGEEEKSYLAQISKIEFFIKTNSRIHMILPAFPAKSPNPRKTVSHKPDYGEVLALKNINHLCEKIGQIYAPGAQITICSDGRVFSDVVLVCDAAVNAYGNEIRNIIDEHGFSNLATFSLDDVFSAHDFDFMRRRLVADYAESTEAVREKVKSDEEALGMFNGIHRFMFEDQMGLNPGISKNRARETAKKLAYEVIRRSNAWSRLVERKFPEALRLSIHPQPVTSRKIGVRLMPSNDIWRTPWHSVTVYDGQNYYLAPREQIESEGGVLKYAHNKYPYYVANGVRELE